MKATCTVDGCTNKVKARGICKRHYESARLRGELDQHALRGPSRGNLVPLTECGVSYRQLDYWCRMGYITLATPAQGSGTRRLITDHEAKAIKALATEVALIEQKWATIRSGVFFTSMVGLFATLDEMRGEVAA